MHSGDSDTDPLSHNKLEQENDPELTDLCDRALTLQEAEEVPVCFYKQNYVLMIEWRPPDASANDEWQIAHQIVVPKVYYREVISIAHDSPMAGHLGIGRVHDRILNHFFWPTLSKDVSEYCRSCHTCQVVVGKHNQKILTALKPIYWLSCVPRQWLPEAIHREIVPPRETVAIAIVAIAIVGRGGWGSLPYTVANENQMKA